MWARVKFLIGFAGGIAGLIGGLALAFVALDETGRLKAPAFANRMSFDEKLRYLRQEPADAPRVLLVGSSTTLHGLDGTVLLQELGLQGEVVNFGVQDLRTNQIRFLADVFLSYWPQVDRVVMVSTMLDFKQCDGSETRFFQPEHVLDYIAGGPALYYYFKYLDLEGVLKRAGEIRHLRSTIHDLESVAFDEHGSLLLEVPRDRITDRIWFGRPITLDPPCYAALRALALDLRAKRIAFTFVVAPMRPGYLAGRDPDGTLLAEHRERLQGALGETGAVLIDAHEALDLPDEAFFDAYHLNRDEVRKLTRFVGERMTVLAKRDEEAVPPAGNRLSAAAQDRAELGHGDRSRPVHRLQRLRRRLHRREQHRHGGQGAGRQGPRDALAAGRPLRGRASRSSAPQLSTVALYALRERAVRDGLPGQRNRPQPRRAQPTGLQPVHRHTHLLRLLPLQGPTLQLVRLHRR